MTGNTPRKTECVECGASLEARRRDQQFCGAKCRQVFHARRKDRGALLYDLFMINRHERGIAKAKRIFFLMTRLAMYWREEDIRERAGRRSWQPAHITLDQTSWGFATVVHRPK